MARPARSALPLDGFFHVTARGVADELVFRDDEDHAAFEALLARTIVRDRWRCLAWCAMNTHYHLVLDAGRVDLSRGLHRLNGRYAQLFNGRHERRGHLFGDRPAMWLVETPEHLFAACRYVILNPVRAGLCAKARDWRWSGPEALKHAV